MSPNYSHNRCPRATPIVRALLYPALLLVQACSEGGTVIAGPREGTRFASISAGAEYTCRLLIDGSSYCWDDLTFGGTLGTGTFTGMEVLPARVVTEERFREI